MLATTPGCPAGALRERTERIQDRTYRGVNSDSSRARSVKGCSPPGNSGGDWRGIRLPLPGGLGTPPRPPDNSGGGGRGVGIRRPDELSTSTSISGRATLIPVKVGPSGLGWLQFSQQNVPSCTSTWATVVRKRTLSSNRGARVLV